MWRALPNDYLCLILTNDNKWDKIYPNHIIMVKKEFVDTINSQTILNAKQFIFSKTDDFEFVKNNIGI